MTEMYARKASGSDHEMERYGSQHYTIFVRDASFPYSLGNLKHDTKDGSWVLYNFGRRDYGMDGLATGTFDNRDAALAFARETYDAAYMAYISRVTEVMDLLRTDLTQVECYEDWSQKTILVMDIIDAVNHGSFAVMMTPQEAITAMESLSGRSSGRYIPRVTGRAMDGQYVLNRNGWAEWRIPNGTNNYHIAGWRGLSGMGRTNRP